MEQVLTYNINTKLVATGCSLFCHKEISVSIPAWEKINICVPSLYSEADNAAMYPNKHLAAIKYINEIPPGKGCY